MFMGNLADLVFTLFLDPVLKAEAITESASRFVHSLFLDAARGVAELFRVEHDTEDTMSTDIVQQQRFQVAKKYTILFDKSQAVGQFFTENIDEIKRGLEEGVFQRVTARELSHLIAAAFAESEKRTALLNALAHF